VGIADRITGKEFGKIKIQDGHQDFFAMKK
jgi:hypothetical protein